MVCRKFRWNWGNISLAKYLLKLFFPSFNDYYGAKNTITNTESICEDSSV